MSSSKYFSNVSSYLLLVLKFANNASIDTLPSFTNLKQWGRRLFDNCPLCKRKSPYPQQLSNYDGKVSMET